MGNEQIIQIESSVMNTRNRKHRKDIANLHNRSQSQPRKNHNQFVVTLWSIFNCTEHKEVCSWNASGDSILIKQIPAFISEVLPQFFNHGNLQSFVRQLNMYDFHKLSMKTSNRQSWQCFQHENFRQGRPDLLCHIKRKSSQSHGIGISSAAPASP